MKDTTGAEVVEQSFDEKKLKTWIGESMEVLNDREKYIVIQRKMIETPRTLEKYWRGAKIVKRTY